MLSFQTVLFNIDCNKFSMHTYIPKVVCLFSWFNSAPFIQLSDQRVKRNITKFFTYSLLTPNDAYMGRTAPLTSKRCILYTYSTNIGTEYFKHALYSPFFSSKCSLFHNANLFGSCIIHILYTGCAEIKKIIPAPKG